MTDKAEKRGADPYQSGKWAGKKPYIVNRTPMEGRVVAVLTSRVEKRGLQLIHPWTRCVRAGEVHELLVTDEMDALPGGTVDRMAAIAFFEFTVGGLLVGGDTFIIGGKTIGNLVGYDETHMPNHQNILLKAPERRTGQAFGLQGGDKVIIQLGPEERP
ncbi:MAG: hypothetical protein O3A88_01650 [Proteobacteria bacterium]|nr:hypothetical protein [Pseudomonadota bacterium]